MDRMDKLYLAVVVPLGIFWTVAELSGFLRRQRDDTQRAVEALNKLTVSHNELCAQLKEAHIGILEVKIAENKRRDDELVAKIARDVRDKVRKNDAADARNAPVYVELTGPGGNKSRESLSLYAARAARGECTPGYVVSGCGTWEVADSETL